MNKLFYSDLFDDPEDLRHALQLRANPNVPLMCLENNVLLNFDNKDHVIDVQPAAVGDGILVYRTSWIFSAFGRI